MIAWDSRSSLVALNALTPVLYAPAWPVAALAAHGRHWALAAAAAVVVAAHVAFLLPELAARTPGPAIAPGAPRLRLFSANVFAGNDDVAGFARDIRAAAPDVAFLQEATPTVTAGLDASGVLAALPYRAVVPVDGPAAGLVASRWPLLDQDVVDVHGGPVLIRATVELGGQPIRLYAVHVVAPFGGGRPVWAESIAAVTAAVRAEPGPTLVAGDFNATWGNRPFRRLLDAGLTDAAAARGSPFQMTWPRDRRILPPLARIDHVLTTPGLAVTGIHRGTGRGSDHRPLVADVAVTRMGSPPPG